MEHSVATTRVVSPPAEARPLEELTFLVDIASFWKFSEKENSYEEGAMRLVAILPCIGVVKKVTGENLLYPSLLRLETFTMY